MRPEPYQHQTDILARSANKEVFGIFAEMGTGKTRVIIDNVAYLYENKGLNTLLVIAGKGAYLVWPLEVPIHMPEHITYRIHTWTGKVSKREKQKLDYMLQPTMDLRILAMNVEAIAHKKAREYAVQFMKSGDGMFVVDESTKIKNHKAMRAKAAKLIARYAKWRRIMSGRPIVQNPLDLFSQFELLDSAILGFNSYYSFRAHFANLETKYRGPSKTYQVVVGYKNKDELAKLIAPHSVVIKKKDCLDLPEKIYEKRILEMSQEQVILYAQLQQEMMIQFEDDEEITVTNALAMMMKLHQITCGIIKTDSGQWRELEDPKLDAIMDIAEETEDKIIIWSPFVKCIERIVDALIEEYGPGTTVSYYGKTSIEDRIGNVKRFQEDEHCRFFVGTPQTGAMGITLTAANTAIYHGNDYNLEHRIQSEDRPHRIGQLKNVTYIDLLCKHTVDFPIIEILKNKLELSDSILMNIKSIISDNFEVS